MNTDSKNPVTFKDFNLSEEILKALGDLNFEIPTPIQEKTIPKLMEKGAKDLIGLASTGTGKTAAFAIPALERIDGNDKSIQVLVMSPTRELAQQVGREFELLGKYTNKKVVVINGGASYTKQKSELRRGVQICVATPGRLIDLINQGVLNLAKVHTVVLDEADEMISMGFREHIENILDRIPTKQTWLFSATMDQQIQRVAQKYLTKPHMVELNTDNGLSPLIDSFYFLVKNENKVTALQRLLLKHPEFYGLIFCQTKAEVAEVESELRAKGLSIESLHGDKKQAEREVVLRKLKAKQISAVVATDVAARGLDVKDLTHVVNYNLPWESESFVHRSGRTGRNGQRGTTWSFISPSQQSQLRSFQKRLGFEWQKGTIPALTDTLAERIQDNVKGLIEKAQVEATQFKLNKFFEKFNDTPMMENLLAMDPKELIRTFFLQAFPEILERDFSVEYEPRPQREGSYEGGASRGGYYRNDRRGGRSGGGGGYRRSADSGSSGGGGYRRDRSTSGGEDRRPRAGADGRPAEVRERVRRTEGTTTETRRSSDSSDRPKATEGKAPYTRSRFASRNKTEERKRF